jgi:hypothetical protein
MKVIDTVGGSIGCSGQRLFDRWIAEGVGDGALGQARDGDDVARFGFSRSAARSRPRKASTLVMRPCSITLPSRDSTFTAWFGFTEPEAMRPVIMRPR